MIIEKFICGPFDTNTLLIVCEETKKAAVVDPSVGAYKKILAYAKKNDLTIESIYLTHSHWDHIGNVAQIKEETNAKVYVHKLDAPNLQNPGKDGLPVFERIKKVVPDKYFEEGDKLKVGTIELQVIHTPGHTPGSVCLYIPKEKVLISGDTLFAGSIGNISFPSSQPKLMWQSLKKLAKLPPDTKVLPGHGESTTIDKEKWISKAEEYFS